MKKSVLIIMTMELGLGGVERSLLGLLDSFDYENYDVDLMLYAHRGELFHLLNHKVNLLPEIKAISRNNCSIFEKIRHRCFYASYVRIKQALFKFSYNEFDRQLVAHKTKPLTKKYDLAIGFFQPFNYLLNNVNASFKLGLVHTDYTLAECDADTLREMYSPLDGIAAVSDSCMSGFIGILPELEKKTFVLENILSQKFVREMSLAQPEISGFHKSGSFCLLSIGRFTRAKNFTNVPEICSKLLKKGLNVIWYLIGFGPQESEIIEKIDIFGMQENVIILGKKDNPYPYIANCDLYVQPSLFEGKSVAVREAQMLGKPVVITDFPTASSQVANGVDGVIVPMDNEKCASEIAKLLNDPARMKMFSENCIARNYSNEEEINKIYDLINQRQWRQV